MGSTIWALQAAARQRRLPRTWLQRQSAPMLIVDMGGAVIAGVLTFIIVTLFLLTGGPPMMARLAAAFADNLNSSYVLNIIEKVRAEVGHFYLMTTLINIGLGLATGGAMWAWTCPRRISGARLPLSSITFLMQDPAPRCW